VAANSSLELSRLLLQDKSAGRPAQYGALVFDDPIIRDIPAALWALENATDFAGLRGAGGALPMLLSGAALPAPVLAGLAGGNPLLSQLGTGGARVLRRLVTRFRDNPGVWLAPFVLVLLLRAISCRSFPFFVVQLKEVEQVMQSYRIKPEVLSSGARLCDGMCHVKRNDVCENPGRRDGDAQRVQLPLAARAAGRIARDAGRRGRGQIRQRQRTRTRLHAQVAPAAADVRAVSAAGQHPHRARLWAVTVMPQDVQSIRKAYLVRILWCPCRDPFLRGSY
jgi:hypothetical protein